MLKLESLLLTQPTMAGGTSKIRSRQFSTLLLSVTAHLFLIMFIDSQIRLVRAPVPNEPSSNQVMKVHIAPPEVTAVTSGTKPHAVDNGTQPTKKPQKSIPPPTASSSTGPRPDRAPPILEDRAPAIVEILLSPTPYYFPTNALTVKPLVSFDIPQDLGTSLTSDLPGSAIFRLQINERGEVDQVIVDESSFSESDQQIVIDAFQKMKFEPGKINEESVKSEMRIEVTMEKTAPLLYPNAVSEHRSTLLNP